MNGYGQLTRAAAAAKPELIIWPTSSLPAALKASRLVSNMVVQLVRETVYFFWWAVPETKKWGLTINETPAYSNSEFLISPTGQLKGQYNKMRLLPFNEYVPLERDSPMA